MFVQKSIPDEFKEGDEIDDYLIKKITQRMLKYYTNEDDLEERFGTLESFKHYCKYFVKKFEETEDD